MSMLNKGETNIKSVCPEVLGTWFRRGRLQLDPIWQRDFIWPRTRQSELIESMLLGLPIGMVHVNLKEDGSYVVFDGRQRLTSIINFFDNDLKIEGLKKIPEINGLLFRQLDDDLQNYISNYSIVLSEFKGETAAFKEAAARINTRGVNLNPTELFNMAYEGPLMELCRELKGNEHFKKLTGVSGHRYKDLGLLFDFFAFGDALRNDSYCGTYKTQIDTFFQKHYNCNAEEISCFEASFKHAINCLKIIFNEETAFRIPAGDGMKLSSVINKPVFRVVAPSFDEYKQVEISKTCDAIREFYFDMVSTPKILEYLKNHTTMKENVDYVNKFWKDGLRKIVNRITENNDKTRFFNYDLKKQLFDVSPVCKLCGNTITYIELSELDHIVPYSNGGLTTVDNAQLVHRSCNRAKGNRS